MEAEPSFKAEWWKPDELHPSTLSKWVSVSSSSPPPSSGLSLFVSTGYVPVSGLETSPPTADPPARWVSSSALLEALDRAIPRDGWLALEARVKAAGVPLNHRLGMKYQEYSENGGYYRGNESPDARVASWNNTRASEQEVIEWFEQAILLL